MIHIAIAGDAGEIERCYSTMAELRPHLTREEFVPRVQLQQRDGYQLAFLENEGEVVAAAGFRLLQNLAWGRFLYVDDLVTKADARSQGFGEKLFEWLVNHAKSHNCQQLHLDSGVQRYGAHRFYLSLNMSITSHHFAMSL
jgi:GNAT superfamily N-acetyltransferase